MSGIRTHDPIVRARKTFHASDSAAIVIGTRDMHVEDLMGNFSHILSLVTVSTLDPSIEPLLRL
jgi:hypothetical protein